MTPISAQTFDSPKTRSPSTESRGGETTKAKAIGYWICTALIAFVFVSGGIAYVMQVPGVVQGVAQLGYPLHFIPFLGVWKVLGGIAVLVPGFALLKEWAYAGMVFDLTGAAVASGATGGAAWHIVAPLVVLVVVAASWALRPASRKLPRA